MSRLEATIKAVFSISEICIEESKSHISSKNAIKAIRELLGQTQSYTELKKLADELQYYRSLDKQGRLIELPCKVGDTIYLVDTDEQMEDELVKACEIDNIVICKDGDILFRDDVYDGVICQLENIVTDKPFLDYYRAFLTKEEAEAKLAELKGEQYGKA